ncbi:MAG: pseudouridine synthase [Crocinitomicaceae bacterium]|nr:pseudouridine synthase [Crocinitomicaceae bacterium]
MSLDRFIHFKKTIDSIELPERFTFPFYYDPHPLSLVAASELQDYLNSQNDWEHNFGLDSRNEAHSIGKMFGVLVVKNNNGELGYLAAFSGKLAGTNEHDLFVPPVFDMLTPDGFFNEGMLGLDALNQRVISLERAENYAISLKKLEAIKTEAGVKIEEHRELMRTAKAARKIRKLEVSEMTDGKEKAAATNSIISESVGLKAQLRTMNKDWSDRIGKVESEVAVYEDEINDLKHLRKEKSKALQKRLFDNYHFLNILGKEKSLWEIFQATSLKQSPSGAGECAAPKLLQYAFKHNLKPVTMAEFWWGDSPRSEIRKHGQFYPSCRGKCEPILGHMLEGIELDDNPMLVVPSIGKKLETIYEDDHILVINKPAEFLSVPGKTIKDSVYHRIQENFPDISGPIIVHRLDMSTSGIMLVAKNKHAHKAIQKQFIDRTIKKRYIALLDGLINEDSGFVELPLRTDINDRPRQLVCEEHGKHARTEWKVIERSEGTTRIHFFPVTGRTHQLRVHASHAKGLNTPIVGDDLYGKRSNRLHLHAEWIKFMHPVTRQTMELQVNADF